MISPLSFLLNNGEKSGGKDTMQHPTQGHAPAGSGGKKRRKEPEKKIAAY